MREWPNLAAMMFGLARAWRTRTLFRFYRDGAWRTMDWESFARQTAGLARGLRAAGIAAGDRVVIVSENRPEVAIAEVALMAIRAVPVPAYVTNTVADHAHVLRDSGARAAIVATAKLAEAVWAAGGDGLDLLVVMDGPPAGTRGFAGLVEALEAPDDIEAETALIPPTALACLIYTSGTGGAPKGVMIPHRALLSNCRGGAAVLRPLRPAGEVYLSFLPASHSYEHMAGLFLLPSVGAEIVFGRGIEQLAADLVTVSPTLMTVVPRLLEVIRGRILMQVARGPAWKRVLFEAALRLGQKRLAGERLGLAEWLVDAVLDRVVRRQIRARFGGRARVVMSGAAWLEPEVGRFFLALGVPVMQGYGQTEAGPAISANRPDDPRPDTVGRPLPGIEVRIAHDGEILVRGDLVMDGYWGDPAATAEVIRDGWLHTGDIGALDADGHLWVTDRKKDIIVLAGGENIAPARIETRLMAEPEIAQAVVAGDGLTALRALVVAAPGCDEAAVTRAITRVNRDLAPPERIRGHRLVEAFTQENGLLTASQKIRRAGVIDRHRGGALRPE